MHFINPIWLFAIAALLIPVIIHLWNIRPGKTLKVGSISLMASSSRKSSRSFNFLDILLLIVRCLFLLLLAFLLAGPFWIKPVKTDEVKGWVLIPKANLNEVYGRFKTKIDSLTKTGFELHEFDRDFEKLSPETIAQLQTHPAKDSISASAQQYWPLLSELSGIMPSTLTAYLFTPNTISHFNGSRPEISLNLRWQTYIPTDSTSNWIQSSRLTPQSDHIKITEGTSTPSGTAFNTAVVQGSEQANSPYQVNINNGQPTVSFKSAKAGMTNPVVPVDTTTLRIAIYSDKANADDAKYLEAALNAVKQFTYRKIDIRQYAIASAIPGGKNWVFWLSTTSLAAVKNADNLFVYEPGKVINQPSIIDFAGQAKTSLYKSIANTSAFKPLWRDGFGNAVLGVEETPTSNHIYHFYNRFNASWNDLVWSDDFPKVMLNLILNQSVESSFLSVESPSKSVESKKIESRALDQQQISPNITQPDTHVVQNRLTDITDLSKVFWLALVVVFLLERWLAHRNKPVENYG